MTDVNTTPVTMVDVLKDRARRLREEAVAAVEAVEAARADARVAYRHCLEAREEVRALSQQRDTGLYQDELVGELSLAQAVLEQCWLGFEQAQRAAQHAAAKAADRDDATAAAIAALPGGRRWWEVAA